MCRRDRSATYRSRQLGLYNILARDIYNICYDSKKWRINAGLVNDSRYFRTFGNGLSITYKVNNNTQITAFGVIHTPGFFATSDNAGLNLRYKVGKARVSQDLIYNTDSGSRVNSYLLNNDIDILRTKETILSINGGVGLKDETSVPVSYTHLDVYKRQDIVAVPLLPPKQLTLVCAVTLAFNTVGCVIVIFAVSVHPSASVTVAI